MSVYKQTQGELHVQYLWKVRKCDIYGIPVLRYMSCGVGGFGWTAQESPEVCGALPRAVPSPRRVQESVQHSHYT